MINFFSTPKPSSIVDESFLEIAHTCSPRIFLRDYDISSKISADGSVFTYVQFWVFASACDQVHSQPRGRGPQETRRHPGEDPLRLRQEGLVSICTRATCTVGVKW